MADTELQQLAKMDRNPVQESRYQELLKQQGNTGGGFQMPDLAGFAREQAAAQKQLMDEQAAKENDFLSRYRAAVTGQEGLGALAGRIGSELGLPQLRQNAFQLQTSLGKIPSVQKQATQGFDVNQNQMDRLIAHKQAELAPSVTAATAQEQNAQQELGTRLGYETAQQAKELQPFVTEGSMLSDRIAREVTGFQESQKSELDALMSQIQMGIQLSQYQMDRADKLAQSEKSYELEKAKIDASTSAGGNNQIIDVKGQKLLIDPSTGKIVSTYGTTNGGGGSYTKYLTGTTSSGGTTNTMPQSWKPISTSYAAPSAFYG